MHASRPLTIVGVQIVSLRLIAGPYGDTSPIAMSSGELSFFGDARRPQIIRLTLALMIAAFGRASVGAAEETVRAIDLRSLPMERLKEMSPLKLRAVVNWSIDQSVFVQDETGGTYFRLAKGMPRPRMGDEVEIIGNPVFRIFIPGINATSLRVLRHGPLPEAFPVTYADLVAGEHHYQRVSIAGRVRALLTLNNRKHLRLSVGAQTLDAELWFQPESLEFMLDRLVRVEGLAVATVPTNNRLRISRPYLRVHSLAEITLLETRDVGSDRPFLRGQAVINYDPAGRVGQSIRVKGTVTGLLSNNRVYLRDEGIAFGLRLNNPANLAIGDVLEAIGYPTMESFNTRISDARIVEHTPGPAPVPVKSSLREYLTGVHANQLVSVEATVVDAFKSGDEWNLVVQDAGRTARVIFPFPTFPPNGSRILVTGICVVHSTYGTGFEEHPVWMALVARTPGDLEILSAPSWWNARRLRTLLLSSGVLSLMGGVWIILLRRQVARQTATLRSNIESEAALRERARIAREFHDTLAQNLTGLQLRLDAIASEQIHEPMEPLLTDSRNLVTRLQAETKNLVSDLRETAEPQANLRTALDELSRQSDIPGTCPRVWTETIGNIPPVPPFVAYQLRMIAQESLTNALKHAAANEVVIRLATTPEQLTLTVADDGCGFDASSLERPEHGHFGCAGMRERCARIEASIAWNSSPGRGTVVEVCLPLSVLT